MTQEISSTRKNVYINSVIEELIINKLNRKCRNILNVQTDFKNYTLYQ